MDKLIIVSVYILVIIIAIVVLIVKNIKLKKTLATKIDKLERDKNLVLSAPILNELSKAESLVKDDKTKVRFDEWQEKFDNIRNNDIPVVTDMLIKADGYVESKNYKELRPLLADIELKIYKLNEKTSKLLGEIKEVTLSEERNRERIVKLKSDYRVIKAEFERDKSSYGEVTEAIELQREIEDINYEIQNLNMGQKSYDKKLILLRDLIQDTLSNKYDQEINVSILADLLEVKHEIWRRPIESYLGPQRFYLFVEPQYVDEAIAIYDANKEQYGFSDFGIVDTDKIAQQSSKVETKSLAESFTNGQYIEGRL